MSAVTGVTVIKALQLDQDRRVVLASCFSLKLLFAGSEIEDKEDDVEKERQLDRQTVE